MAQLQRAGMTNSQPTGGMTAAQPIAPAAQTTDPNVVQLVEALTPVQQRFRQASSPMSVDLQALTFVAPNLSVNTRIASVGLGFRTVTAWHLVFNLVNANAGAQSISFSPWFPFNAISRVQVQVNGGATVYNVSGLGSFEAGHRRARNTKRLTTKTGVGLALDPSIVQINVGANGTVTNSTGENALGGIASIQIAATSTCVLTVDFWTVEKFTLDRDSLIGALPLQNAATYAQITYTLVPAFVGGATQSALFPFFNAGANVSVNLASTSTVQSTYHFWSVPADSGLYADMIGNSYQIQEDSGIAVPSTATDALVYNIPRNILLIAAHLNVFDNNGAVLPANVNESAASLNFVASLRLQYNAGTVRVYQMEYGRHRFAQYIDYGEDYKTIAGYYCWDGEATSETNQQSDNAGWLDCYNAANPQIVGTLGANVVTPATFNLIREQLVVGAIQTA